MKEFKLYYEQLEKEYIEDLFIKQISTMSKYLNIDARRLFDNTEEQFDDYFVEWHNSNKKSYIMKLLSNKLNTIYSQILLYSYLKKDKNLNHKEFLEYLNKEIIIYRGGKGIYNKELDLDKKFISYTIKKDKVKLFSKYNNTQAGTSLSSNPIKNKQYFVLQLKIPIKDISLFYNRSDMDFEVIIKPKISYEKAKLIKQT